MDAGSPPLRDAGVDAARPARDAGTDAGEPTDGGCIPVDDRCGRTEVCGNGADDDCDGRADEDCACEPGRVQSCFLGPPGRRAVGVCADGEQTCGLDRGWGACSGGIWPREDVCNGADNRCDGCSAQLDCPIDCPSPGDARVPDGAPFVDYTLRAADFYPGPIAAVRWSATGGPCDRIAPRLVSFELEGATSAVATFRPRLSGDYTITLSVTTPTGAALTCSWIVHVAGPGLRVELCYPESETQDLDLFLHRPGSTADWYAVGATSFQPLQDSCGWHDCEATIRGTLPGGFGLVPRADWGYAPSPLSECEGGPQGDQWRALGFCANPRLDIDNNLAEGTGLPENINVDAPREGETFRIMVDNFSGLPSRPILNVYCGGRRVATFGTPPDELRGFEGDRGDISVGAMWRVADVTTRLSASGETTCDVEQLHPPETGTGYYITYGDGRF